MPENSKTFSKKENIPSRWLAILTAALIICAYLTGLTFALVGPDEPRYAQVAREMFLRSDWVTPTLGGFSWFEKPALLYWLQIASYRMFGVSEFAARFGSAIFGLSTIFSLWMLGHFATKDKTAGRSFADWLALITASSIGIIVFSRGASFDIIVTFPMTAALAGFYIFDQGKRMRVRNLGLVAFYAFIGLAILAKGLIGIVFPYAIVTFYFVLSKKLPTREFILSTIWGTALSAAVAATWYLPMYLEHGHPFVQEFIIEHHFQRFTSNKYFHPQPFYFFFWVLPLMTIPWLPFFARAVWRLIWNFFTGTSEYQIDSETTSSFRKFAAAWLLVPLVFFSFSGSKLPGYILPAIPAALMLSADAVFRYISANRRRAVGLYSLGLATLAVVVVLAIFAAPRFEDRDSVKRLIATADARGHGGEAVISMHTFVHNAEYYAAGRLLRSPDGKQAKLLGPLNVRDEIRLDPNHRVLVLVPLEYVRQLTDAEYLNSEVIADNGELAVVAVSER